MAGISVSLEGSNIQLSFQKDDQSTAVIMDASAARALVRAVGQLLTVRHEPDLSRYSLMFGDATAGFADQSHMNRAFQSQYGTTPARYRQRMFQTSKTTPWAPP